MTSWHPVLAYCAFCVWTLLTPERRGPLTELCYRDVLSFVSLFKVILNNILSGWKFLNFPSNFYQNNFNCVFEFQTPTFPESHQYGPVVPLWENFEQQFTPSCHSERQNRWWWHGVFPGIFRHNLIVDLFWFWTSIMLGNQSEFSEQEFEQKTGGWKQTKSTEEEPVF